jgi:hypothetical protein
MNKNNKTRFYYQIMTDRRFEEWNKLDKKILWLPSVEEATDFAQKLSTFLKAEVRLSTPEGLSEYFSHRKYKNPNRLEDQEDYEEDY